MFTSQFSRRSLLQMTGNGGGGSALNSTTQAIVGVILGSVLLLVFFCYCFANMRRHRLRAAEELAAQEQEAQHQAARAERRRRRNAAKGVPPYIIQTFPTREYVPDAAALAHSPSLLDPETRKRMMMAATHALTTADDDPRSKNPPAAQLTTQGSLTKLGEVVKTALIPPRSVRQATATAQPSIPSAPEAPWSVENDENESTPQQSLAAAHRASAGAAASLGRLPASMIKSSSLHRLASRPERTASPGLDSDTLDAEKGFQNLSYLPEGEEDDANQCAICLCEFEAGEMLRQLPCQHDFHQTCIDSWMLQHQTCPLCRYVLWEDPNQQQQQQQQDSGAEANPERVVLQVEGHPAPVL